MGGRERRDEGRVIGLCLVIGRIKYRSVFLFFLLWLSFVNVKEKIWAVYMVWSLFCLHPLHPRKKNMYIYIITREKRKGKIKKKMFASMFSHVRMYVFIYVRM